jgi:carbonic anhydrase
MSLSLAETLALLTVRAVVLLGAGACGGGGAEVRSEVSTTTTGEQRIDVKKALGSGVVTQQECENGRKRSFVQSSVVAVEITGRNRP